MPESPRTRGRMWRGCAAAGFLLAFGGCGEAPGRATGAEADSALAELLREIQPEVERSSGLAARRPPRLARASAERLEAYLVEQFREQLPAEEAATVTAVYARFGLLPDTLDLRETLLALYREQVVGYYDPVSDTLFVVDGVPDRQLRMVLAHELVHALQDQHVDLDSLRRALAEDNDRGTALQAATEGHATLAMLEMEMGRMSGGRADVTTLPDLGEQFAGMDLGALGRDAGLPALGRVPRVLREALVFPYVGGLSLVQRLWKAEEGRPAPFGRWLPASTEQVLHPDRFLAPGRDEPTGLEFEEAPPEGWEEVHADGLGELETRIFLEEHLADAAMGRSAAAGWDGDRYRLLRGPEGEALVWVSVWDSEAEADEFASAVLEAFAARYGAGPDPAAATGMESAATGAAEDRIRILEVGDRRVRVERRGVGGRPGVRVLDLPEALPAEVGAGAARIRVAPAP